MLVFHLVVSARRSFLSSREEWRKERGVYDLMGEENNGGTVESQEELTEVV